MIEPENAQARLENIRSVQPILSALHTISLGSWQAALNQRGRVQGYAERLETLLPVVTMHLPPSSRREKRSRRVDAVSTEEAQIAILVIGSERGLCGRFNAAVVERAEAHLADQEASVKLMALGGRVRRILERHGHQIAWSGTLSITTLPSFDLARTLARDWLASYEAHELDAVDLIYNAYRGLGSYEPTVTRLIPPARPFISPVSRGNRGEEEIPVIIETNPVSLYTRVIEQLTATRLYELLLESASAEHAGRYELMGAATQNTDRLVDELTLAIQTTRQQAITQEMQELAAGAGMIGTTRKSHLEN
jgi:F-type H+-transporting ATPase subunit gamma